ncbi:MAG: L,D-transpeptidase catalytic domain [Gammaproteobacteria bacterium]|jgi:hypothetical protein|nr:L,D-transpeptidase catalytic domain [Gammaproteobacteria bacterium]
MKKIAKSVLTLALLPACLLPSWTIASANNSSETSRVDTLTIAESIYSNPIKANTPQPRTLTVIDYSLPSNSKDAWIRDMQNKYTFSYMLVSHRKDSEETSTGHFSNESDNHASMLTII